MADTITLEIITPEQIVLQDNAEMVVLPAADGQLGILPKHAPLLTFLEEGAVVLYRNNQPVRTITIKGGFAEVTGEKCVVLAEHVAVA